MKFKVYVDYKDYGYAEVEAESREQLETDLDSMGMYEMLDLFEPQQEYSFDNYEIYEVEEEEKELPLDDFDKPIPFMEI